MRLVNKNSQSPNLGRAYFSCSQDHKCDFFQWVNRTWSKYVLEVHRRLRQMPVIPSILRAPENEWQKADRQLCQGESPLPPQPLILHGDMCHDSCIRDFLCSLDNKRVLRTVGAMSFISTWRLVHVSVVG